MPAEQKSIPEVLSELWELLLAYGRQRTVDPIKGLGRYIGYGIAAALVGAVGVVVLMLSLLRVLQTQTDGRLSGNWSWVPYLVVLVVLGALVALAIRAIAAKASGASTAKEIDPVSEHR